MVALVAAMTGDRCQAEDIAQEAFARALTRWPQVARYDLPEAWVRRVAIRLTVDALRRMRRAVRLSARLAAGQPGSGRDDPGDPLAATALSVALLRMPLPQRQVLVLYYLADLPVEEIARADPARALRDSAAAERIHRGRAGHTSRRGVASVR
jgi:RNA polymerase sigma-70 factor, ECF subfamily